MGETDHGSEQQRRKIVLRTPATVEAFVEASGLDMSAVTYELKTMGIHARPNFVMPQEVLQALGAKHGLQVEFVPPSHV